MLRLTQTVKKGGCAAKIPAAVLREILSANPPPIIDKDLVLVDGKTFDDAAIYKLTDELSLVQTLDFFTPMVDTPYNFGQIAAANALSDVYAMGGKPITCMAILAFPLAEFEQSVISEILQGAFDVAKKGAVNFVGGHSIDDDTLKFGLSVNGTVANDSIWTNSSAKEGDVLILTKPLGTGTLTAGIKRSVYTEADVQDAIDSMACLNNICDYLPKDLIQSINGATDITGFGISGHAMQMAQASNKTFKIDLNSLPLFSKARESIERGHLTKAHRTNEEYTSPFIKIDSNDTFLQKIVHDPQTSGGLLLSVESSRADSIVNSLKTSFPDVAVIGRVCPKDDVALNFV